MEEVLTKESEELESDEEKDIVNPPSEETELDFEAEAEAIEKALPELSGNIKDPSQNERYKELRALGLSPEEAYLATAPRERRSDSRSHLTGSVPKAASAPSLAMSREELAIARSLFEDLEDGEIRKLYKKVNK